MLGNKELHAEVLNHSKSRIETLTIRVSTLEDRIKYIIDILRSKKLIIEKETSLRLNRFSFRSYPLGTETYRREFSDYEGFDIILLQSYVNAYNKMCKIRLFALKEIRQLTKYLHIKYNEFNFIIKKLHLEIGNAILDGMIYHAQGIGDFKISEFDFTNNNRTFIDRPASRIAKAKILANGGTLCSKDNPTGEKYIIHKKYEYRYYLVFTRNNCIITNNSRLCCKFVSYNHSGLEENFIHTIKHNEILELNMGICNKLYVLLKAIPLHYLKYRR